VTCKKANLWDINEILFCFFFHEKSSIAIKIIRLLFHLKQHITQPQNDQDEF